MIYKKTISFLIGIVFLNSGNAIFAQFLPDFVDTIKTEKTKVVHISTTSKKNTPQELDRGNPFFRFFPEIPQERKERALGSGFIYNADGYIITNNHVIDGADTIEVILSDTSSFEAKVIGADARTDLAVLKIDAKKKFPPVKFGNSDNVEVGQWVIAIGNPLGLDQTVTVGIVSAKNRDILGGTAYGQFLQTDAAINFGNSGGPLLNVRGELIGINTAIAGGQGLGFAIPSNIAQNIISQLLTKGKVTRGWLGVGIQDLTTELTESLKLKNGQRGVVVNQVFPNSPAKKSGVKEQDLIVGVNNKKILNSNDLQLVVAETTPNTAVNLIILRDGKTVRLKTVIAEFKEENVKLSQRSTQRTLGLQLSSVNPKVMQDYNLAVDQGVLIVSIAPDSPLIESLQPNDVILKINNKTVKRVEDFEEELVKIKSNISFVLLINRNGYQIVVPARLD